MTRIGIVGAGAAAAAAAFELDRAAPDASVTVLEKSGGVCGRAATRRNGELTYDYGANYVSSDDERVADLLTEQLDATGLVEIDEPIYTFDEAGDVSPGRESDTHRWTYREGLTQIAKRLFDRTDATVHRRTRVETIAHADREENAGPGGTTRDENDGGTWTVRDADGRAWGPFDVLVLNPPAPQTATLLETAEWNSPTRSALAEAAATVPYRAIWTAALHYDFELSVPYYGLVNTDRAHEVGWFSREECKPGHVPDGETLLIVQAAPDWSADREDATPADVVAELATHAADVIGEQRLRTPGWTDHQQWRYALPNEAIDPEPVRDAEAAGLYCLGDWVAGEARVHAALANGLETGERLASSL